MMDEMTEQFNISGKNAFLPGHEEIDLPHGKQVLLDTILQWHHRCLLGSVLPKMTVAGLKRCK